MLLLKYTMRFTVWIYRCSTNTCSIQCTVCSKHTVDLLSLHIVMLQVSKLEVLLCLMSNNCVVSPACSSNHILQILTLYLCSTQKGGKTFICMLLNENPQYTVRIPITCCYGTLGKLISEMCASSEPLWLFKLCLWQAKGFAKLFYFRYITHMIHWVILVQVLSLFYHSTWKQSALLYE